VSFNSFDPLGDEEREWLRARPQRPNVRRLWFAVAVLIVILIGLWWLIFRGLFQGDPLTKVPSPPTTVAAQPPTTAAPGGGRFAAADQRLIADARRGLAAWGEFAISGDLTKLDGTFWKDGLQYQKLAKEAPALRSKRTGPPPYQFALTPSRVQDARDREPSGQKIVRGTVRVTRPGERTQTFNWDVYLRRVPNSNPERWAIWTVANTPK
jgi:hypothetical protein